MARAVTKRSGLIANSFDLSEINGLYGLYSYIGNNINLRKTNKRINEINYVHDLPLDKDINDDNIIIQHLKSNCTIDDNNNIVKYYPNIKSFQFIPYDDTKKEDNKKIEELIKNTYFTEDLDIENLKWTKLNELKRFRYRGYSDEISEKIINSYADKATEILKDKDNYKLDGYTEIRKKALELQSKRRCDAIHKHPNKSTNFSDESENLLLEEVIKDFQMLLSSVKTGQKYLKNSKIYCDPYTLVNEKLGVLSWNMIINKATINCIMNNHDVLFPIRIILDMDSKTLFYDNILQSNKYSNYMGFFLIRFINDNDEYTKYSKPHDSKEQYYIFFVYKNENEFFNLPLHTYTLTNFRNNIINWGTVTEKKTVLFYEILQLICMYLNNNVHFYLISIEKNGSIDNDIMKSWIYSKDLNDINIEKNEIHILVSKYNIDNIGDKLNKPIWNKKNYKYIEYNEKYKLIQCHFGWYSDPDDKFCIKLGDMKQELKNNLKNNACINEINSELFKLDILRYIKTIGKINIINADLDKDSIIHLKINEFLH